MAYASREPKAQIRRLKQALGAFYRVDIDGLLFADLSTPGGRSEAEALDIKAKNGSPTLWGSIVGSEQMIGQVTIELRKVSVAETFATYHILVRRRPTGRTRNKPLIGLSSAFQTEPAVRFTIVNSRNWLLAKGRGRVSLQTDSGQLEA